MLTPVCSVLMLMPVCTCAHARRYALASDLPGAHELGAQLAEVGDDMAEMADDLLDMTDELADDLLDMTDELANVEVDV